MAVDVCSSLPFGSTRRLCYFLSVLLIFPFAVNPALLSHYRNNQTVSSSVPAFPMQRQRFLMDSEGNTSKYVERVDKASKLRDAFKAMGADFFNDTKIVDVVKDATELNLPIIKANRYLVASENGGLHNPSCLVFNPEWTRDHVETGSKRFKYPNLSGVQKPNNDEDIAFMSVLELGELIRTKQITSKELVRIYLERLKRYNHALEAVITYTDELAYSQAKVADELLSKGVYLGPLHGIPYGLKDIIAVPGYKTTWGSRSFKDQVLNTEAWVYKRLQGPFLLPSLFLDRLHMMTSGLEAGQETLGILKNFQPGHQLGLLRAPRLVWCPSQLGRKQLDQLHTLQLVVV